MDDATHTALAIGPHSTAWERTIDITTTGRKTGLPRRIEIWFHRLGESWYLSTLPGQPHWAANLVANPRFTVHLKHGLTRDLPATAAPITDPTERRRVFTAIVDDMNQAHNPARIRQPTHLEDWMSGSPLLEIRFDQ